MNTKQKLLFLLCLVSNVMLIIFACTSSDVSADSQTSTNSSSGTGEIIPNSLSYMQSAFGVLQSLVNTTSDERYFYVHSYGIPEHDMMVGITNWQQQVPIPQSYTETNAWAIPLKPEMASTPTSTKNAFMKGAIALAINGIPIFNPLNNRGEDAYLIGELDEYGGHSGRADDYHYHIAPLHLQKISNNGPIAYALDGFPIYGSTEADGSPMQTLDDNHGHMAVISGDNAPSTAEQSYHYHGTMEYPYFIGNMVGLVNVESGGNEKETQIVPQAKSTGVRDATSPLLGATITNFEKISDQNFKLSYTLASQPTTTYQIEYSWDSAMKNYVYKFFENGELINEENYTARPEKKAPRKQSPNSQNNNNKR